MQKNQNSKFVLGTAQFGGFYGLRENNKNVTNIEFDKIINYSKKKKINFLDTARSYGTCEKRLSFKNLKKFNIITKIFIPPNSNQKPEVWIGSQIKEMLENLNLRKIYGVLFHNSNFFYGVGSSKKIAEHLAADNLLKDMNIK